MSQQEKRRSPRVPLTGKVKVETVRGTFNAHGRDLSDGGMGVYLAKLPPLGSPITIRFQLPNLAETIEITGEVRYHEHGRPGTSDDWIGIRFLRMDGASQAAIHSFVKANYDPTNPRPPALPPAPAKK